MWDYISAENPSLNFELWHNLDNVKGFGALRRGDLKYLYWRNPSIFNLAENFENNNERNSSYNISAVTSSEAAIAITALLTYKQIKEKHNEGSFTTMATLSEELILSLRLSPSTIQNVSQHPCLPTSNSCLFNITEDPSETNDLSAQMPIEVARFKKDIEWILRSAVVSRSRIRDPEGDPSKHNGTWTNWQDSEEENTAKSGLGHIPVVATIALMIIIGFLLLVRKIQQEPENGKNSEEAAEEGANGVNLQLLNEQKMGNE